jgi:hypothetical protein
MRNPRGFGLASTRAPAKARSLGGLRLNPNDVGWESVGTSWSTSGDKVTLGTDCIVVSGTRATSSKLFASALASSACSGLACRGETALVFVSSAKSIPGAPPVGVSALSTCSVRPPLGCRRCRLVRQPTRRCLLLGLGCPAFPFVGGEEGGMSSKVVLPPRGEDVVDSTAGGRAVGRHCRCRAAVEGVSCHSCRRRT